MSGSGSNTKSDSGRQRHIYRRAFALVDRRTRRRLFATVPLAVIASALEAVGLALILPYIELVASEGTDVSSLPDVLRWIANLFGAETQSELTVVLGISILVLLLSKTAFTAMLVYVQFRIVLRGETILAVNMFREYIHAPYQFHVNMNSAEAIRNVRASIHSIVRQVMLPWISIMTELSLVVVIATVLFLIDPPLTIAAGLFLAVVALVYSRGLSQLAHRMGREEAEFARQGLQVMHEGLAGIKPLRTLNREDYAVERFRKLRYAWEPIKYRTMFLATAPRFYLEFVVVIGAGLMTAVVLASNPGTRGIGLLGVMLAATFRLLPSLNRILSASSLARVGGASVEIVEETNKMLEEYHGLDGVNDDQLPVSLEHKISLEQVDYHYPNAANVAVTDISFEVPKGSSVGLVGASGAGKTTLVDLLLGLMRPTGGRITVDGVELDEFTVRSWRNLLGYVPQDIYLADTTLRENIAFGQSPDEIDEDRLQSAVEDAQLADLVSSLPDGLDSMVGEGGVRLSGGQRQRIGIARALYPQPEILLLDEATSALDSATEAGVSAVVQSLRGEITLVIIAHRLSTVRDCDLLVMLEGGRIRGMGSFDELADRDDKFAELVKLADLSRRP